MTNRRRVWWQRRGSGQGDCNGRRRARRQRRGGGRFRDKEEEGVTVTARIGCDGVKEEKGAASVVRRRAQRRQGVGGRGISSRRV